jgi:hypothetical protein
MDAVRTCDVDCMPDACGNELRQDKLMRQQDRHDDRPWWQRAFERDKKLLGACLILVILLNINTGRYVLYPFRIFSTWIHEMCHGMAAILSGGGIRRLKIYNDGSGMAWTTGGHLGFVASAGYPGTSVVGCLLLLFRRTTLGPTIGTIGLGVALVLSCIFLVRNLFGGLFLTGEGLVLIGCGWLLPATLLDHLFAFLAAVICLNSVQNIDYLFGASQGYVNGAVLNTDAHTVAENWGGDYRMWAWIWFSLSIFLFLVGIFCARDAREISWNKSPSSPSSNFSLAMWKA